MDTDTSAGADAAAISLPVGMRCPDADALARFVATLETLRAQSTDAGPWMSLGGVLTCDGGALAAALIARALNVPVRLCSGLYWHNDPSLRAELMGDCPDDGTDGRRAWAEHLRWVARNAMDEHHHWVILWPGDIAAVLVDPNGPIRREPHIGPVSPEAGNGEVADVGLEPRWRLDGRSETYAELPARDPWRAAAYDPDDDWDRIADACYPGLRAAVTTAVATAVTTAAAVVA